MLEDTLAALRRNAEALSEREVADDAASALRAGLFRAEAAVDRARQDFVAASPIGSAALEQESVQRSDLDSVLALAGDRDDELARAIRRLAARPFGEALATIAERAPDWAARDGKRVELIVEGREVRMPAGARRRARRSDDSPREELRRARHRSRGGPRRTLGKPLIGTVWASAQEGEPRADDRRGG